MKVRSVTISRNTFPNSPIRKFCEDRSLHLYDQSFIDFEAIPFDTIPQSEWLFFYSKKGATYFFDQWRGKPSEILQKIGCMGVPTANVVQAKLHREVNFIGSGTTEEIAEQLLQQYPKSITFIRADNSLKSIQTIVQDKTKCLDLVVYRSYIIPDLIIPSSDIVIFTSPLNVESFFKDHNLNDVQYVIAIGSTTKSVLQNYYKGVIHIPKEASEIEIVNLLQEIS